MTISSSVPTVRTDLQQSVLCRIFFHPCRQIEKKGRCQIRFGPPKIVTPGSISHIEYGPGGEYLILNMDLGVNILL